VKITTLDVFINVFFFFVAEVPLEPGYRSAVQTNAIIVALQMLNLMLDRTLTLLKEQNESNRTELNENLVVLLPGLKIMCDWLLTHSSVWNPPPLLNDLRVGYVSLIKIFNFM